MSNEFVMVPRGLLAEAEASLRSTGFDVSLSADLRKVLAQPAEQHQGEPVAWLDLSKLTVAHMAYATKIKVNHRQEPLYTHTDPGEVERLRKENARLRLNISEMNEDARIRDGQIAELREAFNESQEEVVKRGKTLAEALALLRDIDEFLDSEPQIPSLGLDLEKRLSAALSASAEPTAIDPRECRKCGSLTADECKAGGCWFEREPSAPCPAGSDCCIDGHSLWCPNHPNNANAPSRSTSRDS